MRPPLLRALRVKVVLAALLASTLTLAGDAKRDDRGWYVAEGALASGTAIVLSGGGPWPTPGLDVSLLSPDAKAADLDELVTRPTLLFYYSAGCPHCVHVAPEIPLLAARLEDRVDVIAIASGSNSLSQLRAFGKGAGFGDLPHYKDFTRKYAAANDIRSTPTVLLVQPAEGGGFESMGEFRPFFGGAGLVAEIRLRVALGDDPYAAFEPGRYYGSKACGNCHVEEYGSWGLSQHSLSYWTIYERELTREPDCVQCHVTGLGEPTGFVLGDDGSSLGEVGCEACHGPGGPHAGPERAPLAESRGVCVTCHDADHSLLFDPAAALPHVDHYTAAVLSPEAFQSAREELLAGRAEKPLLAFPAGRNLGVEPCRACHAEQVKAWEKGPHAGAMKSLKRKGSQKDTGCIACHAVAKKDAPARPADWYGEGVGCEACHGPGEKHLADEGKGPILGLGTTCPECVIEGICTRCHTPEQDPEWELKAAMEKVRH